MPDRSREHGQQPEEVFVEPSALFSRERLAEYDPARLSAGVVAIVGCGAAGNNIVLNLALSGVGELRLIDFDVVETSNLTRSPLFQRDRVGGARKRSKAHEVARGVLAHSYAEDPLVRVAVARFESLGFGAFAGADVIVSAVDSFGARATLSGIARRLGIPFVTLGFSAPQGHVAVFSNRSDDESCWRCLNPLVTAEGVSCRLYAEAVVAEGRVPATQSVAATFGAIAAEAIVQALHGRFPLGGRIFTLDIQTGRSNTLEIEPNARCPGVHERYGELRPIDVGADDPLSAVHAALAGVLSDPIVHLRSAFVVEAPCVTCGRSVPIGRPAWTLREAPRCKSCESSRASVSDGAIVVARIAANDPLAARRCRRLGLPPGAVFEVEDRATGQTLAVKLQGSVEDLYASIRRPAARGADDVDSSRFVAVPRADANGAVTEGRESA